MFVNEWLLTFQRKWHFIKKYLTIILINSDYFWYTLVISWGKIKYKQSNVTGNVGDDMKYTCSWLRKKTSLTPLVGHRLLDILYIFLYYWNWNAADEQLYCRFPGITWLSHFLRKFRNDSTFWGNIRRLTSTICRGVIGNIQPWDLQSLGQMCYSSGWNHIKVHGYFNSEVESPWWSLTTKIACALP